MITTDDDARAAAGLARAVRGSVLTWTVPLPG